MICDEFFRTPPSNCTRLNIFRKCFVPSSVLLFPFGRKTTGRLVLTGCFFHSKFRKSSVVWRSLGGSMRCVRACWVGHTKRPRQLYLVYVHILLFRILAATATTTTSLTADAQVLYCLLWSSAHPAKFLHAPLWPSSFLERRRFFLQAYRFCRLLTVLALFHESYNSRITGGHPPSLYKVVQGVCQAGWKRRPDLF